MKAKRLELIQKLAQATIADKTSGFSETTLAEETLVLIDGYVKLQKENQELKNELDHAVAFDYNHKVKPEKVFSLDSKCPYCHDEGVIGRDFKHCKYCGETEESQNEGWDKGGSPT